MSPGSAIVRSLHERHPNCLITIVDIKQPSDSPTQNPTPQYFEASTTSLDDLLRAFRMARPQVIIHTAAIIPPLSERYSRRLEKLVTEVNVEGTRIVLDAARQTGCSALVYTSSCCAVTDDMSVPYANIDERWPVSSVSSIYGESKVCKLGLRIFPPEMTFLGPSRGIGAGSLQPDNAHMRVAPVRLIRQRGYATDSANTRLSRQARDTLGCRGWHQSLGRNLRGECGRCACACCGEFDVLEDCCRGSILHPEQRADTVSRFHSRSLEEFWTRMWQAPFFSYALCLSNSYMVLTFCTSAIP